MSLECGVGKTNIISISVKMCKIADKNNAKENYSCLLTIKSYSSIEDKVVQFGWDTRFVQHHHAFQSCLKHV